MKQILERSFDFSIRSMELIRYLKEEDRQFPLYEQFLTCATGIGSSLRLALMPEEISVIELSHALSCAIEVEYHLELMVKTGYLQEKQSQPILDDCRWLISAISEISLKQIE